MLSRLNEYPFVINKHLKVFIFLEITSDLLAVRFIPKSRYFLLYIAPFPQLIERNTETKLQVRFQGLFKVANERQKTSLC